MAGRNEADRPQIASVATSYRALTKAETDSGNGAELRLELVYEYRNKSKRAQ